MYFSIIVRVDLSLLVIKFFGKKFNSVVFNLGTFFVPIAIFLTMASQTSPVEISYNVAFFRYNSFYELF